MLLKTQVTIVEKQKSTCLIVGIFDDNTLTKTAKSLDKITGGQLQAALSANGTTIKLGLVLPIFNPANIAAEQIILVGCGSKDGVTPMAFRKIALASMRAASGKQGATITTYLTDVSVKDQSTTWKVKQLAECAIEANYRFDHFRSKKEDPVTVNTFTIHIANHPELKACEKALKQGEAVATGVAYTKNLANLPSNICTPFFLVESARKLAKEYKSLSLKVLDEKQMQKLGMGALLGVAQGSAMDAYMICIEYHGAAKSKAPIALVGKGITFDTGGNSLKTPDNMVGMKYDMCGGATVLGTIKAACELQLAINIVGIIPAVENMPGGTAYKPEDILESMSGQTIEVISTDAEGRLILADALTYCERYKPEYVIDIATLTGAVVIALGTHATGLISNDEKLTQSLLSAGTESNDRAWPLPLWDEYQEQIKSPFADISNTGGRTAGTITAGCFLSRFAKKFRWAHLDVAGTAAMMMGGSDRYATGRPVPLLTQFLIDKSQKN